MMKNILATVVAVAALLPMAASAAKYDGPVNAWTVSYKTALSSSTDPDNFNIFGLAVQGTSIAGCSTLFLIENSNFDDAKIFITEYLAAKTSNLNMTLNYDTTRCMISSFAISPN